MIQTKGCELQEMEGVRRELVFTDRRANEFWALVYCKYAKGQFPFAVGQRATRT